MRPVGLAAASIPAVAVLATTGCGAVDDSVAARVDHFHAALAANDAAGACADLAEETRTALERQEGAPCEEAITRQRLPHSSAAGDVVVYGSMAQVRMDGETVFLSRFDDGWRVIAAGCAPTTGDRPHECALEVG